MGLAKSKDILHFATFFQKTSPQYCLVKNQIFSKFRIASVRIPKIY